MHKLQFTICMLVLPIITTGCASITGTENQSVSVQTHQQAGTEIVGASCELTNNKGKWFVTTPGSVTVHRSNDDMQVLCKKESLENGRAAVVSDTKGSMWGNIIFGGGIGAVIDHNKGTAYEYPTVIDILMGSFTKIETPKNPANQQDNPQPVNTNNTSQQAAVPTQTSAVAIPASETSAPTNLSKKLRELKNLKDDGTITEEEYASKKKQLLENL